MDSTDKHFSKVPPVSTGSQAQFLEQLSEEDFWAYARSSVQSLPAAPVQSEEYLVCELEDVACVLPLAAFHEAVPVPDHFTFLPAAPLWMPGITAWHGEVLAAIDLGAYLAGRASQAFTGGMLLIAHDSDMLLGLLVASIRATITVQAEQLTSRPTSLRVEVLPGVFADAIVLDVPAILLDVVQHTGTTL